MEILFIVHNIKTNYYIGKMWMYGLGSDDIEFRPYWTFVKKQGFHR